MNKLSFSTGALFPLETKDAFKLIKNAGFEHAELMPQCFSDISEDNMKKYDKIGLHIASIHYPLAFFGLLYTAHETMSKEGRAYSKNLVEFASRMNTEVIVIHTSTDYKGEMKEVLDKKVKDNIYYLAEVCEKYAITLAVENSPYGLSLEPKGLEDYVKAFDRKIMKTIVDTTECLEGGTDPIEYISKLENCPSHMHFSDFKDNIKHLPITQGSIDWKTLINLLKEKGYNGYWTHEPTYRYYLSDIENKIRRDYENMFGLIYG